MSDRGDNSTASTSETQKSVSEAELRARNSEIEALEKLLRSGTLRPERLRDTQRRLLELKGIHVDEDNDD